MTPIPPRANPRIHSLAVAVTLAAAVLLPAGAHAGAPRPTTWTTLDGQEAAAFRGAVEVPEDRHDPASRSLELAYVRLASTGESPGPPIVYLAGGPGASGIESARGPRSTMLLALRRAGDVVLLDQRGTGASRPALVCRKSWELPRRPAPTRKAALVEVLGAAEECAARAAAQGAHLSAYNVREVADDVEALRRALGVEQVSLVATSFGTRLALEVLRRHPGSVARAVLLGVVGPDDVAKLPAAVDDVLKQVDEGDGTSLWASLRSALAAVEERPAPATGVDVLTGEDVPLEVGPFDLQLAASRHVGSAAGLAHLREVAVHLARGDYDPVAADVLRQHKSWLGHLMPYALTCSSGASPERRREIREQAPGSLLGENLDFGFPEICDALGVSPLDEEVRRPVRSDVPVQIVAGTLDTRTPLANAEEVLRGLSHGGLLVVEGAGHGEDLFVSTPEIAERTEAFLAGAEPVSERIAALPLWRRLPLPPATEVHEVTETLHGVEVTDSYRWLEDSGTPEARIWVRHQNGYTDRLLEGLPGRMELRRQLEALVSVQRAERPWVRGERQVYRRSDADDRLPRILMRDGEGEERTLLDPAALDPGGEVGLQVLDLSVDGRLVAFSERRRGAQEVVVRFLEIGGEILADRLPAGRYFGVSIAPDGRGAYYARELDSGEGARYYFHRFGSDPAQDPVIFGEGYGRGSVVWGNLSDDGRYLVLHGVSGTQQRIDVFLDRVDADGGPTGHDTSHRLEVVQGIDATFYAGVLGDHLVVHTTWKAPRGRVFVAPVATPGMEHWREIVPEDAHAVIRRVFGAGGRLIVEYLEDVHSRLAIYDLEGRHLGDVPLPALGTLGGMSGRWNGDDLYFTFSSFHLPPIVYRYDLRSGRLAPWSRRSEAALDPAGYEVRQVRFPSKDGVEVPMFLIHRRGLALDGSHPTLVTAYGGFATSLTPAFDPAAALWVARGGVYAVVNVRGGGELGAAWHQAAVREHKQRSIDDLLAALDWLVTQGYTRPELLATWGHSAGGLLVAAAMVQRPDAVRAVVSTHPLLDMLRYNRFLAARFWIAEYGSPDRDDAFPYLYAYSPYHHVKAGTVYPAVFLMTSFGDTQVDGLHARKMAARLQGVARPDRPVVLRHYQRTGHGGAGVTTAHRIDELTDIFSFLFWQLGEP